MDLQLPCECGQHVLATEGMAGTSVRCACGRAIAVPSFGELRRLAGPNVDIGHTVATDPSDDNALLRPSGAVVYSAMVAWTCFVALPVLLVLLVYGTWIVTLGFALVVAGHFGADRRCVLAQYPSNLTGPQPSLVYEVKQGADGEGDLVWDGVSDWTAKQLLSQRRPRRHPQRDRAAEFLKELLSDGPKTSRQVWAANETHGFSVNTLLAAYRRLDIRFHKVQSGGDRFSYWMLPGQQPPPPPPRDPSTDLMPFFHDQLKRLPPASPLDDVA